MNGFPVKHPSRRMALLPWCREVDAILSHTEPINDEIGEVRRMWQAGLSPVEAAAAIAVAEFERTLQS